MGSRNRRLLDRLGRQDASFKLGDALPKAVKEQLGVDPKAPTGKVTPPSLTVGHAARVLSIIEQGDPRMLAAHLLSGDVAVHDIPPRLMQAVLGCVRRHHKAVTDRDDETIRQQREALEALNRAARERDESRASTESDVARQRRTAQEMGRQVGDLHRDLEQARLKIGELEQSLRTSQSEASDLRADLAAAKEEQLGDTEGAIFRRFLDLVNVQVAQWLTDREGLFRKAESLCSRLEERAGQADDLLLEVKACVEDAEAAQVERVFEGDERDWIAFIDKVEQMRRFLSEHSAIIQEVQRLSQQRSECTDAYEGLDRKGKELTFQIHSVVEAFSLIGVDIFARAGLNPDLLDSLGASDRVVKLMMQAIPAQELSEDWTQRIEALQSHILVAKPKRAGKKEPAPEPAQVQFFPGRIFMVEPEREVERLVGILLHELHAAGFTNALFPGEIALLLMRSGLTNLAREPMTSEVTVACQALIGRGLISRHPRFMEDVQITGKAFAARDVFTAQYARVELAQVGGRHGEKLCEKLRRVIPTKA